ncbi:CoA pyrophosphatase [Mesorhizobium sp. NBSH29]|uniref:CoA pyrophosphatase n=1 Tax=Mesorhizobium sp. NBSH29 TaxID=2654249 RepID=UPI0018964D98|nr:CoA pyrophosphatase [Mesorhizobium sp. NBSH29]QPC85314.1 CoA pyrophosphatase [Mesorhizobium sp. NBSH29]
MDVRSEIRFSAEDFRLRAARQGGAPADIDYGDHCLNPGSRDLLLKAGMRDAAVLIPVVDRGADSSLLLTLRTEHLRNHAGQVAFPGGAIDAEDASPEAAAVRETTEEIGLGPDDIEIVGRMPDYLSGSGFRIAPVLGIVRADYLMTLNQDEVADAFEVPLRFVMDPQNHIMDSRMWQGHERYFYAIQFGERRIWGVTAGIVRTLYERLYT